jgi:hypothetical protein
MRISWIPSHCVARLATSCEPAVLQDATLADQERIASIVR